MRVTLFVCALALAGCRDWGVFSEHFDAGTGGGVGGGSGGGTGGGGGSGGGGLDPTSCLSRGEDSCPSGVLFCDDFPSTTLASAWTVDQMNGTVAPEGECTYRGSDALHSHLNSLSANVPGRADVLESVSGEPLPGNQFVRAMVRLNAPVPAMPVRLLEVHQQSPGTNVVRLLYSSGQLSVAALSGAVPAGSVAFPVDRWVCVEWQLQEGAPGSTRVWLDGASAAAIEGQLGASDLKSLAVGAQSSDHALEVGATDAWFDDVVVSATRAGCP